MIASIFNTLLPGLAEFHISIPFFDKIHVSFFRKKLIYFIKNVKLNRKYFYLYLSIKSSLI